MTEKEFRFVVRSIAVRVFLCDSGQARWNVLLRSAASMFFTQLPQPIAKRIVRKLSQCFGRLLVAGQVASGASIQFPGEESVEVLVECRSVRGRCRQRTGQSQ